MYDERERDPEALIRGETVCLRAARPGDAVRWFEAQSDPDQRRFGTPAFVTPPTSADDHAERVASSRDALAELRPGRLVVVRPDALDDFVGDVAWRHEAHPDLLVADVGYSVHPGERRRGVATDALRLLVRWLLHDVDGPHQARVQLDHSVENEPSCRTALAAGMEREGVRRGFLPLREPGPPGGASSVVRRHDVCLHGVLR